MDLSVPEESVDNYVILSKYVFFDLTIQWAYSYSWELVRLAEFQAVLKVEIIGWHLYP